MWRQLPGPRFSVWIAVPDSTRLCNLLWFWCHSESEDRDDRSPELTTQNCIPVGAQIRRLRTVCRQTRKGWSRMLTCRLAIWSCGLGGGDWQGWRWTGEAIEGRAGGEGESKKAVRGTRASATSAGGKRQVRDRAESAGEASRPEVYIGSDRKRWGTKRRTKRYGLF